ncbi:hypothetical protein LT679_02645 [Mucilaginibacter roseus]|uniref:ATP-binding protein n=1 Tax=Mucilaginibacter roseus TaxID=1528868 RepID=A0ABS8TX84_9SPHI|nr:hypothetical protein [Mucilaginibacter roseus]MCD8739489.1 hypothetical protein [Mucilaginibacter roseus]
MRITTTRKEFIFLNDSLVLTPSLKQVLAFLEDSTGASLVENYELHFKVKSITTELLTNGFKHSHANTVNLLVDIDSSHIIIQKYDSGPPVTFGKPGPVAGKVQLSYDIMCRLFANYTGEHNVSFSIEECTDDEIPDIESVTEHFGLLIIAKCADEFTYHYNAENRLNLFTAVIKLPSA